ncbi:MAG: signal peptidase II [Kofleriaceae bacterium]|nr:signal peptidase II [Kofleriaceae bacterium]
MADTPAAPAATGPARLAGDMKRAWMIFAIIAVLSLVADQASKYWARDTLPVRPTGCEIPADIVAHRCVGVPVEVVADYWDWRLAFNTGAAFSMFSSTGGGRWLLTVVGIAAVLGMLYMMRKARPDQKALHWALGLVASGAVGNLIDRIYFGSVTDFVVWKYQGKEWPAFNIADVALVVGVGLMFVDMFREWRLERAARAAA